MRRWAFKIAVLGFFALALIGWACELSPLSCALRALGGAAVLFVALKIAGRIAAVIVADGLVKSVSRREESGRAER